MKKVTIQTASGPISVVSIDEMLRSVKVQQTDGGPYSFNRLDSRSTFTPDNYNVGEEDISSYERKDVHQDAFMPMNVEIAKAWLLRQARGVRFASLSDEGSLSMLIEDEACQHAAEFSSPTSLVRMGRRLWAMLDTSALRLLVSSEGSVLVSDKKAAISLIEVGR